MKLLIEGYKYNVADVFDILNGLFTLQDVEQKISINYVGYYYNPQEKVRDIVFILPKVLIDERDYIFGKYSPCALIHLDEAKIDEHERKFLYEFAVWIHRAIIVFNNSHENNDIVLHQEIEYMGKGYYRKKSNTLLDIILSLIRFNKENQQLFTTILKNTHSGVNKINWCKTIARTTAIVQEDNPIHLNPIHKRQMINFDEELIVIFFSILKHISDTYGFKSKINFGFKLITGARFKKYLNGFGRIRMRQIKYRYFSDAAIKLWNLCYAFFEKTHQIRMHISQSEYLVVKSFHVVFEAMIDELIGMPRNQIPKGLADQYDGKVVDHFYTYKGLFDNKPNDNIYYIGDSKYYKIGNNLGPESLYKQRTYARNVIQWNLGIWLDDIPNMDSPFEQIQIFDEMTEGYNVIPNFFISAAINQATLSYEDSLLLHVPQPQLSRQFKNRLYDRDTLLLSHYDVNFLFVLALYARNNHMAKIQWRKNVRAKFRTVIQNMLKDKFDFYAITAHPDVDASVYFKSHFQDVLGKTFRPYDNQQIFSLALDKTFPEDNNGLLSTLGENFYVVPVDLGEDPSERLEHEKSRKERNEIPDSIGQFLTCWINNDTGRDEQKQDIQSYALFQTHQAEGSTYIISNMPIGDISKAKYLLPVLDNYFDGYYEINSMSFGSRKVVAKDGVREISVDLPTLIIHIGQFHTTAEHTLSNNIIHQIQINNNVLSYTELMDLIAESNKSKYNQEDQEKKPEVSTLGG